VARTLHALSSRRVAQAAGHGEHRRLPEGVFESELFGHVKGAFTDARMDRVGRFELADGGTLFLDEIANVPMRQQAKLLRVLETGEIERVGSSKTKHVDVRVISATNSNLHAEVAGGRFREDLLFRLNTIEIPYRRCASGAKISRCWRCISWAIYAQRYRKGREGFEASALQVLLDHPWPGNVRELDHSVERAVLMAQGAQVRPATWRCVPAAAKARRAWRT
jgi:transcriptional regulator with GAF, ATPase, and Fis domain